MKRVRRVLASWRVELAGLAGFCCLFLLATMSITVATLSISADTISTGSYCYAGLQCSTTGTCPSVSTCTTAGFQCGKFVSGTNLSTCSGPYTGYTCVVNTGGPYACTQSCQCVCKADFWGALYCGPASTPSCTTSGTNPTKCTR